MVKLPIILNATLLLSISFFCHGMKKRAADFITRNGRQSKTEQKITSLEFRLRNITGKTYPDCIQRAKVKISIYNKLLATENIGDLRKKKYLKKRSIAESQIQEKRLYNDIQKTLQCLKEPLSKKSLHDQYNFLREKQACLLNLYTQLIETLYKRVRNTINKRMKKHIHKTIAKLALEQKETCNILRTQLEECYEDREYEKFLSRKKKKYKKLKIEILERLEYLNTFEETIPVIAAKQHLMQLHLLVDSKACSEYNKKLAELERKRCHLIMWEEILAIEYTHPTEPNILRELLQKYKKAQSYCLQDDVNMKYYKSRCDELEEECKRSKIIQKIHTASLKKETVKDWETLRHLYAEIQQYCVYNTQLQKQYKEKHALATQMIATTKKAERKIFLENTIATLESKQPTVDMAQKLIDAIQELQTHLQHSTPYWNKCKRRLELLRMQKNQLTRRAHTKEKQRRKDQELLSNWMTADSLQETIRIDSPEKKRASKKSQLTTLAISSDKIAQTYLVQATED